jgi:NTE family protein
MEEIPNVNIYKKPSIVVLSGGGMNGFNILGALSYLNDKSILENVNTYIGTSAGGMIGYLLAIGYTPIEIVVYFQKKNVGKSVTNFNLVSMINGNGAITFAPFQTHLEKMTIEKIGQFLNLGELHQKLGKKLVLCTYNLTENKAEYISPDTHPSVPCLTALRMTSNLPFLFEDFKYMSSYYIDGGVIDNFPIGQVPPNEKAVGISLDPTSKYSKNSEDTNFMEYTFHLMMIPINKDIDIKIKEAREKGHDIIKLSKKSLTRFIDFSMDNRETLDLFSDGYNDAKKFYEEV